VLKRNLTTRYPARAANAGKCILITGAGGYIGSRLAQALAAAAPRFLVLLDHSEHQLHEIDLDLRDRGGVPYAAILGDICDRPFIAEMFERFKPDIVFHAAACKHVPLMENNPLAAIRTNAIGTWHLLEAAERYAVARLLLISTDKAVNPASVMGAAKRVAEMALERFAGARLVAQTMRLGNVLGSRGSVGPRFDRQIAKGGPVTVTHESAERYFFSPDETVEMILALAPLASGIFIPQSGPPTRISHLAERMIRESAGRNGRDVAITFSGLRAGDKLTEEFTRAGETAKATSDSRLLEVCGPRLGDEEFDALMARLIGAVEERNLPQALAALLGFVPEYRPSEVVLDMAKTTEAARA
jgi:FlaA1/EpsC-like NDP-sugar epimerase